MPPRGPAGIARGALNVPNRPRERQSSPGVDHHYPGLRPGKPAGPGRPAPRFGRRASRRPQAPAGPAGARLQAPQQRDVGGVGRDRQGARVAATDQGRVDEPRLPSLARSTRVDVGEQPAVDVAPLAVEHQAHRSPVHQAVVLGAGLRAVALDRSAGLHRLGRVDADVADVLVLALDRDLDRVPVDHADHLRAHRMPGRRRAGIPAFARPASPDPHARDEERHDQEQRHRRETTSAPHLPLQPKVSAARPHADPTCPGAGADGSSVPVGTPRNVKRFASNIPLGRFHPA